MSFDHITMLQIDAGKARMYSVTYPGKGEKRFTFKSDTRINLDLSGQTYGIVRRSVDGTPAVVEIHEDVTDTFQPAEDVTYNWLIDTIYGYNFDEQVRKFKADRKAEHRLEHAKAMQGVRDLQAEMGVNILTGESLNPFNAITSHVPEAPEPEEYSGDQVEEPAPKVADDTQS